jgi:hypothetical protein
MRQIQIISETGSELVSLSEAKFYCKVDYNNDDGLITRMIEQARVWCENYISKDIMSKQRKYFLPKTNGLFDLPFAPVNTIDEVKINGTTSTAYEIIGLNKETLELNSGENEKVEITYTTLGLNDNLIKQAILQLVGTYYENREDFVVGYSINEIPTNVKSILSSFKTMFV